MSNFKFNMAKNAGLFRVKFSEQESLTYTSEDIRRIQMVNTISLIGIVNLLIYGVVYSFISFTTFWVAIVFYTSTALLTLGIIILNNKKRHNLAKLLVVLVFPAYLTINSTLLFGKSANSQVYMLLFALIPLFVYGFNQKKHLISFIGLNLVLYLIIEFFPPFTSPKYGVPSDYVNFFRSFNVFIAFSGAFVAIIYFKKFSIQKEQQLIAQTKELKTSIEHRDLVYSIIAHDLRTPFNGLMSLSEIMVEQFDSFDNAKIKKLLGAMHESSTNLDHLLVNLLDWSKMQSGNLKTEFKPFALKEPTDDVVHLLSDAAQNKGITVSNQIKPETMVLADAYMVSTIIRNLLGNAIKFTTQGGTITLNAHHIESEIRISIADSGVGIPESNIEKLFSSKSNFITYGTNHEKGSGLGLKVCHDFVIANGGRIWAESQVNKGSVFYFTLKPHQ